MTRTTIRTTLLSWVVLRAFVGFATVVLGDSVGFAVAGLSLVLGASILLILGVAAIAVIDISVARERLFLANLGVSRRTIAGISFGVATALEFMAYLALSALGAGGA
ncbi:MAG: hypothetical protein PVJ76_04180 [Gemmatimonadota bacterium]